MAACAWCGKETNNPRYCSRACGGSAQKVVLKGKPQSEFFRERMRTNNPSMRPEVAAKISASQKGKPRPDMLGDRNPSRRPEVIETLREINHMRYAKEREARKFICASCGDDCMSPAGTRRKYCSYECFVVAQRKRGGIIEEAKTHACVVCGNPTTNKVVCGNECRMIVLKGRKATEETRQKLSAAGRNRRDSPETIEKRAKKNRGKKRDASFRLSMSEHANARVLAGTHQFLNPEVRARAWAAATRAMGARPNYVESQLGILLDDIFPNEYRYNDGWFTLGRKIPDFVNVNGKKRLIELFGEAWHEPEEVESRITFFKQFGEWETLIIWAKEMKHENRESLIAKLEAFHNA